LFTRTMEHDLACSLLVDKTINSLSIFAFFAQMQNEVYTYKMFWNKMIVQILSRLCNGIDDHEKQGHWQMILRPSIPATAKTILSSWFYEHKWHPDGWLMKHNIRICAHGWMQRWGISY
jgi:hypothetical protein